MGGIIGIAIAFLLLVAIWAGLSRRHWFLRAATVCVVLTALYPIRALEPLVWLALAMPLTAWFSCLTARLCAARPATDQLPLPVAIGCQFRLVDFFLAVALAGVISALGAGLWREEVALDWRAGVVVLCCVVLTQMCLIFVLTRRWWRVSAAGALLIAIGGASALYAWVLHDSNVVNLLSYPDSFSVRVSTGVFLFSWVSALVVFPLLLVGAATNQPAEVRRGRALIRVLARIVLVTVALTVLVPMLLLYIRMVEGPTFPRNSYSEPNCYPKIQAAIEEAARLNPSQVNIEDLKRASETAKAKQLEQLFSDVLAVLQVPGHVAIDFEKTTRREYLERIAPDGPKPRGLSRMFRAQSEDAAAAGRPDEAAHYALASMQLGNTLSRGGLCLHTLTGIAVEGIGSYGMVKIRKELSATQVKSLIEALQRIDQSREPFAITAAREAAFRDQAYHWIPRMQVALASFFGVNYETPRTRLAAIHAKRRDATLRLLIADLAIQLYQAKHGRFPDDFEQLVPKFIKSVPIDPYSGKPVIYRQTKEAPVVYCVGIDGKDNGGRFGTRNVLLEPGFDYDLEVITRFGS